ncbi:uncharacterized protein LOC117108034 isoform X3 [Anneissia japonica]|uniref:uncharacterized protein LOC117108034 isoform X1 n=1 Tax=Anneissia japonica TaxID=1529436 RepID=UPI0014257E9B|nr:uncharacterized protein LOC117108034 isoform X1 [Anneissia japonica]XP_033105771.1 uncharacterized protein LOC117108034 isoform X3 [Anneissia japonica]XP_033105772.1 uncharacterized protein LOC117108034 isoform X3 [Anneissia japonica]
MKDPHIGTKILGGKKLSGTSGENAVVEPLKKKLDVPEWFHGLIARNVAEDLLLKNPYAQTGLFLVRQSCNRGGKFVISVCAGSHVNHYLIDTLESMFYVRRDSRQDQGRDIQARDLWGLIECYKHTALDATGLELKEPLNRTTPVKVSAPLTAITNSACNHNYIPLYADERDFISLQPFTSDDFQMLPFQKGEILTVLQKDSKQWWFAHDCQGRLGYIPSANVCSLKEFNSGENGFCNPVCLENELDTFGPKSENTGKTFVREVDCNANCENDRHNSDLFPVESIIGDTLESFSTHVPLDCISRYFRSKEHAKLTEMQRMLDLKLGRILPPKRRHCSEPCSSNIPDCRRDLKPNSCKKECRKVKPKALPPTPPEIRRDLKPMWPTASKSQKHLYMRRHNSLLIKGVKTDVHHLESLAELEPISAPNSPLGDCGMESSSYLKLSESATGVSFHGNPFCATNPTALCS